MKKFTGHERDPLGFTDYMLGRTYLYPFMRFATPDPARDGWSLYAYTGNNPVKFIDPDGNEILVAKGHHKRVTSQLQSSKHLRELYVQLDQDNRVRSRVGLVGKSKLNTIAESQLSIRKEGGKVVKIEGPIRIPLKESGSAATLGHELTHTQEILDTNMSLSERAKAGDTSVWESGTRNSDSTYESQQAADAEDLIQTESTAYENAKKNGQVHDQYDISWTCEKSWCRASIKEKK